VSEAPQGLASQPAILKYAIGGAVTLVVLVVVGALVYSWIGKAKRSSLQKAMLAQVASAEGLIGEKKFEEAASSLKKLQHQCNEQGRGLAQVEDRVRDTRQKLASERDAHYVGLVNSDCSRAQDLCSRYQFDQAQATLSSSTANLRHVSDGRQHQAAEKKINGVLQELSAAKVDYDRKIADGWEVFDGRLTSPEEKQRIVAERKAAEERRIADMKAAREREFAKAFPVLPHDIFGACLGEHIDAIKRKLESRGIEITALKPKDERWGYVELQFNGNLAGDSTVKKSLFRFYNDHLYKIVLTIGDYNDATGMALSDAFDTLIQNDQIFRSG